MEDNIVTLRTFDNPVLAHIIRARLEAMEIPCFLADEHMISLNPLFNPAIGGIKLKVFEKDYHRSLALLDEDQTSFLMITQKLRILRFPVQLASRRMLAMAMLQRKDLDCSLSCSLLY